MSKLLAVSMFLFSAFLPLGALAAEQGRNDRKDKVEGGDSVHVAVCVGSDMDHREVLLLDRMCLNRDAVGAVLTDVSNLKTERDTLVNMVNIIQNEKHDLEVTKNQQVLIAGIAGAGAAAVVITAILVGLKASGNLK